MFAKFVVMKLICNIVWLQVIEMSGVCAASDIWSVGCTVIELLTCVPPYYDLQPMPALFRIVQVLITIRIIFFFKLGISNQCLLSFALFRCS